MSGSRTPAGAPDTQGVPGPEPSTLERLNQARVFFEQGLILEAEYSRLKAQILGLPAAAVAAAGEVEASKQHQLMDKETSARKNLREAFSAWAGTPDAPVCQGDLWEHLFGGAGHSVRPKLERLIGASPTWTAVNKILRDTKMGEVPAGIDSPLARTAVREFLARTAAVVGAHSLHKFGLMEDYTEEDRDELVEKLVTLFRDDRPAEQAINLLSAVKSLAGTSLGKRKADHQAGGAGKAARVDTTKMEVKRCFNCGSDKHIKSDCPKLKAKQKE